MTEPPEFTTNELVTPDPPLATFILYWKVKLPALRNISPLILGYPPMGNSPNPPLAALVSEFTHEKSNCRCALIQNSPLLKSSLVCVPRVCKTHGTANSLDDEIAFSFP